MRQIVNMVVHKETCAKNVLVFPYKLIRKMPNREVMNGKSWIPAIMLYIFSLLLRLNAVCILEKQQYTNIKDFLATGLIWSLIKLTMCAVFLAANETAEAILTIVENCFDILMTRVKRRNIISIFFQYVNNLDYIMKFTPWIPRI